MLLHASPSLLSPEEGEARLRGFRLCTGSEMTTTTRQSIANLVTARDDDGWRRWDFSSSAQFSASARVADPDGAAARAEHTRRHAL